MKKKQARLARKAAQRAAKPPPPRQAKAVPVAVPAHLLQDAAVGDGGTMTSTSHGEQDEFTRDGDGGGGGDADSESESAVRRTPWLETEHVRRVYDAIPGQWSNTRYKPWPRVAQFIE